MYSVQSIGGAAQVVDVQNSTHTYAADAEASDAYVIVLDPPITAYANGQEFTFKANTANTGAASLAVDGLAATTIKKLHDQDLVDNDIEAGSIVTVIYDGTNFQMSSQTAIGAAVPTTITMADESSDTTCFVTFATAATGDLQPKTASGFTFDSSIDALTVSDSFVSDGGGLVIGHPAQITTNTVAELQILGTGLSDSNMTLGRWSANASNAALCFVKSRNATIGSFTIVQDNDKLGGAKWFPDDGVDYATLSARFTAEVDDATPAAGDIGTAFVWEQMPGAAGALRETMRLSAAGDLTLLNPLAVAQGGSGAGTFTDGGVLLGSGTGAFTAMAALADSEMIVGDGTTDPVAESGATLRTSIGVGTGDNLTFSKLTIDGSAGQDIDHLNILNSDVATGLSTIVNGSDVTTDTFYTISKGSSAFGGAFVRCFGETGMGIPYFVESYAGAPTTTNTTSSLSAMNFFCGEHAGANNLLNMAAESNLVSFGEITSTGTRLTRMLVKADDGEIWTGGGHKLFSDDAGALGASGTAFSDLFLASGGVINFDSGDITLTHSANVLTLGGGTLVLSTDLAVTEGGTGASSFTDGAILLGSGTGAITALDATTKGNLVVGDGTTDPIALAVGTNDQVLTAASGEASGVKWAAAAGGGGGDTSDYQEFTGSGTWTKPTGTYAMVIVECIGAGGGAGGAEGRAISNTRNGGGGGGGGARVVFQFNVDDLGATETVTIGASGTGGAGGTDNNGSPGGTGGTTTFGSLITARGGIGALGVITDGDGGAWGDTTVVLTNANTHGILGADSGGNEAGWIANFGGGGGAGAGTSGGVSFVGGSSVHSGGGGATGGGVSSGDSVSPGLAGGNSGTWDTGGGGAGGAAGGTAGTAGATVKGLAGTGGGGGGANNTGTGGAGGAGGPAGGGGGGGAGGTNTGGAGGAGGVGECRVWTF